MCFSILGMHIFGCKFSLKTEAGDTVPDRKNFDSLLWAIVTVFQVLSTHMLPPFFSSVSVIQHLPLCVFPVDSDTGGLEHGVVQRHGIHLALCCSIFRSPDDFWKLCPLQFIGGHLG